MLMVAKPTAVDWSLCGGKKMSTITLVCSLLEFQKDSKQSSNYTDYMLFCSDLIVVNVFSNKNNHFCGVVKWLKSF